MSNQEGHSNKPPLKLCLKIIKPYKKAWQEVVIRHVIIYVKYGQ